MSFNPIPNKDTRIRNVVLTWFCESDELSTIRTRIELFCSSYSDSYYYIGNIEKTEKEKTHIHILIALKNALQWSCWEKTLRSNFPGVHYEACQFLKEYKSYLSKEGLYSTNYIEPNPSSLPLKVDIYSLFMEDLDNGYTKKQLMRKYPSLFIRYFDNITKLINDYFCEE